MAKTYELDVKPLLEFEGGGIINGYYSKGHIDAEEFVAEVIHGYEPERTPIVADVQFSYWRLVPAGMGDGTMLFKSAEPGKHGAFPVTVWNI